MHLVSPQRSGADAAESKPNPGRIFDTLLYGHARVEALNTAIELDIFTATAEGCTTVVGLATSAYSVPPDSVTCACYPRLRPRRR